MSDSLDVITVGRFPTHLCLHTGYTSRILIKHPEEFDDPTWPETNPEEYDEDDMKKFLNNRGALFIHDSGSGDGLYPISDNDDEINTVKKILEIGGVDSGYIVFDIVDIDVFCIMKNMIGLEYCANFSLSNIVESFHLIERNRGFDIFVIRFDTDSR